MNMPEYLYEYMDCLELIQRLNRCDLPLIGIADVLNRGHFWKPDGCDRWTAKLVQDHLPQSRRTYQ